MKPRYYGLLILSIVLIISTGYINKTGTDKKGKGHEIKITIQHVKDSLCYLYHHFGDKQRAVDTVPLDASGRCVFTGDEPLSGGIYIVYIPNKVYFEIIVNEQFFSLETDTGDFIGKMKITGSVENKIFNDYQKYRKVQYNKSQALKKRLDNNKNNPDSTKIIEDLMKKVGTETEKYTLDLIENNKEAFFVKVLKMTKPIDIPKPPKDANGNIIDSNFALRYHQMHYFDNVDFSDDRVLRTPVFHQKIEDYLKLLTTPHPDSVIRAIDFILLKARANEEIFRYTLATLYNKYNTSKIMGYDAIFVHISEKYYMSGLAPWADSAFVADITKRVKELSTSLIGDKAKDFVLADTNNVRIPMYAVKAKYLILFFYEPDCGHCKKATPKMKALYDELHQYDIEVLGINIKTDVEEWKEFIHKYNLNWINVADPYHQSNFRSYYDVRSTPTIFLLDKDKTIIAKRLGPEQLRELLGQILKIQLPDVEWDDDKQDKEEDDEHKK